MPREVSFKADQPVTGVTVECANCNAEDQFAASDLRDELAARGIPSGDGLRVVLQRLGLHPDVSFTDAMKPEGYTIASAPGVLTLTGATGAGVFYAAQTVTQMIERTANDGFVRPVSMLLTYAGSMPNRSAASSIVQPRVLRSARTRRPKARIYLRNADVSRW